MTEYKVKSSEVVLRARNYEVTKDRLVLPSGLEIEREVVRHNGAVVIIPQISDDRLLLIKQFRFALGRTLIEFPAGTLEKGEAPLPCARREIREETGYGAGEFIELGTLYPAPGFCDEVQHLFLAKGLYESPMDGDEDEIIEVIQMSPREFEEAVAENAVLDAKSIAAYTRAKLRGLL